MMTRLYVACGAFVLLLGLGVGQTAGLGGHQPTVELGHFQLAPQSSEWVTHSIGQ